MLQTLGRRAPRLVRGVLALAGRAPAHARTLWVRAVARRGLWYTDRYGVTLELRPEDNLPFHFSRRTHFDDPGAVALLQRIVTPGMTVLDVGAHVGAFALLAARLLRGRGSVHAFEPTGATFERLERNVAHSPQLAPSIVLNRLAVARADAELVLHTFPPGLSAWNTLGEPELVDGRGRRRRPTGAERVRAVSVDSYCAARPLARVDLLKIDVEGFEDEVLRGAAGLIARGALPRVLFEISLAPLAGTSKAPQDVLAAFCEHGYTLFSIDAGGALAPIEDVAGFAAPFFANYLAVHRSAQLPPTAAA